MAKHDAVQMFCFTFKPFGNGVVTSYAPQTGGTLNIWALGRMLSTQSRCQPLCTFNSRDGQGDVIDFCLRIIDNGNSDLRILAIIVLFYLVGMQVLRLLLCRFVCAGTGICHCNILDGYRFMGVNPVNSLDANKYLDNHILFYTVFHPLFMSLKQDIFYFISDFLISNVPAYIR